MPNAPAKKCLLGFDFGTAKIGIATGQTVTNTATPLNIISASDGVPNWITLAAILSEWQPDLIIVGLPLNMDD